MATGTCMQCKKRSTQLTKTATGRPLCPDCQARLSGAAAGVIAAGGFDSPDAVPQAIATAGWLQRVKELRKKKA